MTMSLVGPYLTTTNYKKRKQKGLTKKDRQAKVEHEAWLESMGVGRKQLESKLYDEYGNRKSVNSIPDYRADSRALPTSDLVAGVAPAKERKQYTGDEIAGIVTTHKSNLMPVRKDNKKAIVDAAQMRRN
jgi:hypothetical protein